MNKIIKMFEQHRAVRYFCQTFISYKKISRPKTRYFKKNYFLAHLTALIQHCTNKYNSTDIANRKNSTFNKNPKDSKNSTSPK